ncbi:MAG: THUMP domain-containing protein [Breznakibacter sp.]
MKLVAKTFSGLEPVLAKELEALGATTVKQVKRAVTFDASKELMYKANLHLRTAVRILQPVTSFTARHEDELYQKIYDFDWSHFLKPEQTLAIDAITYSDIFTHSKYVALKIKDAICDQFKKKFGKRPSVDLDAPTLLLNVHVAQDKFTVSFDSSGESLNRRGYRTGEHPSPMNECLAAGLVLISGWDGQSPFIDPMCGSGTIVLEAAMIAAKIAPNLKRTNFGFTRWNNFDAELWEKLRKEAEEQIVTPSVKIIGGDIMAASIDIARQSALDFGLKKYIHFENAAFDGLKTIAKNGTIIMNPPYGERLRPRDIVQLYLGIGKTLERNYEGFDAWIISSNIDAMELMDIEPIEKLTLFNGPLECRYAKYQLYKGERKEQPVKPVRRRIMRDGTTSIVK